MKINWDINVSDILTSLTISISVVALIISWSKDRYLQKKEQAKQVRTAVAKILAKLDRWETLQISVFQELQPIFVETSEILSKDYNLIEARDYLWKRINLQRTIIAGKLLEEEIEITYVELFACFPTVRNLLLKTISELRVVEEELLNEFIESTQDDILAFTEKQESYNSAMLGNALRSTAFKYKSSLRKSIIQVMQPIRDLLHEVVGKSDRELLAQDVTQVKRDVRGNMARHGTKESRWR